MQGGNPPGPDLTSVGVAAAALVTGVGALTLTGALGRVQRDYGLEFATAVCFTLAGATLWVVEGLLNKRHSWLKGVGVVLTVIGLAGGYIFAIVSSGDTEEPAVTLKLSADGSQASGDVKVSDLGPRQRVDLYVDGLTAKPGGGYVRTNLYASFLGPDKDGSVSDGFSVAVPPATFDAVGISAYKASGSPATCGIDSVLNSSSQGTGCVILQLPDQPPAPDLSASWVGTSSATNTLDVALKASTARISKQGDFVAFEVVGSRGKKSYFLYRSNMAPPRAGFIQRTLRIYVPSKMRTVCAQAWYERGNVWPAKPRCRGPATAGTASVELSVPGT